MPSDVIPGASDTFRYNINLCTAIRCMQQNDACITITANPRSLLPSSRITTTLQHTATKRGRAVFSGEHYRASPAALDHLGKAERILARIVNTVTKHDFTKIIISQTRENHVRERISWTYYSPKAHRYKF